MSQSLTMVAATLGLKIASEAEVCDLIRPVLEGSFGADWQRRSKIVYALKEAWQVGQQNGEQELLKRLNDNLQEAASVYRVGAVNLYMTESTARVLEIKDSRTDNVVDRQTFVF